MGDFLLSVLKTIINGGDPDQLRWWYFLRKFIWNSSVWITPFWRRVEYMSDIDEPWLCDVRLKRCLGNALATAPGGVGIKPHTLRARADTDNQTNNTHHASTGSRYNRTPPALISGGKRINSWDTATGTWDIPVDGKSNWVSKKVRTSFFHLPFISK